MPRYWFWMQVVIIVFVLAEHRDRDHEARMSVFASILVGTDGSDTARPRWRTRSISRAELGARLLIVSAYEPVPADRLRSERLEAPGISSG